ncbi:GNAT family N-acetyltransferase [Propionivibrio limicola]|uniref:GNAT family N-acetyltransferase n=1 Tax=Propionivibrio limicola TaxID=167645 RepID=UPI001292932D|nr:GNAT family N-acetyltransferase [Propionivibrio limicola]
MNAYRIRPLDKAVDTTAFQCGQPSLDEYIRRYASQDARRNVARVFVATPASDDSHLAGFFTLSAGSIACTELPEALAKKLPRYPVPVALIGRLAVDVGFQGKGLGSILLVDACQKVANASAVLAMAGIVVEAKDDSTASFYQHFGFQHLPGSPTRLLLPAAAFFAS